MYVRAKFIKYSVIIHMTLLTHPDCTSASNDNETAVTKTVIFFMTMTLYSYIHLSMHSIAKVNLTAS